MLIHPLAATAKRDIRLAVAVLLSLGFHAFAFGQFAKLFAPQSSFGDVPNTVAWVAGAPRGSLDVRLDAAPLLAKMTPLAPAPEPIVRAAAAELKTDLADRTQTNVLPNKVIAKAPEGAKVLAGAADAETQSSLQHFLRPSDVDITSHPLNAPDVSGLGDAQGYAGQIVRLRIYVDATGKVAHVDALPRTHADESAIEIIEQAITATQFVPAMLHNEPVASFTDVELSVEALRPLPAKTLDSVRRMTNSNRFSGASE